MRLRLWPVLIGVLAVVGLGAIAPGASATTNGPGGSTAPNTTFASCPRGSKPAIIAGNFKCLRAGQRCKAKYQRAYQKYGFHCVNGRLRKGTGIPVAAPEPPPPTPTPAPTPAAIDGHYKGLTSQNETFEFDILNGGTLFRGLKTGQINAGCTPPLHTYGNYLNFPTYTVPVSLSGDFVIDGDLGGYFVGGWPASAHVTIRGHMAGQTGIGSLELKIAFRDSSAGISYTCGSGLQNWTVNRTG